MPRTLAFIPLLALFACTDAPTEPTGDTGTAPTGTDTGTADRCPDGQLVLSGAILEDLTLTRDCDYLLSGTVSVGTEDLGREGERTTLTIEAGVRLFGEKETNGLLVINRGGRIEANGTVNRPVIMSSDQDIGARAAGDWGGLIISGNATVNCPNLDELGFVDPSIDCTGDGVGESGPFGGELDEDSSGTLNYVRIEFAGSVLEPDTTATTGEEVQTVEYNGLTLQGVGSDTEIDFIQVHKSGDDGLQIVGGDARVRHMVITESTDDGLDWSNGWAGFGQFMVIQSSRTVGDRGIEGDNNLVQDAVTPQSNPTLSNIAVIGAPDNEEAGVGVHLDAGTLVQLWNAQVVGFTNGCLDMDGESTFAQGVLRRETTMRNVNHRLHHAVPRRWRWVRGHAEQLVPRPGGQRARWL